MSAKTYTVEIPPIHYLLLGLGTTNFTNEKPEIAKEEALFYLSKILREAVEKEVIEISDFTNDFSTDLTKLTNLAQSIYTTENGNLNFERILQCKIKYTFNNYILKNAVFNRQIHGSPTEKITSYGFFALTESHSDKHSKSILIKIKNEKKENSKTLLGRRNEDDDQLNYFDKLKMQEAKQLYFDKENNYQKEIVKTNSFLKFEKIFLSFQNTFIITKYLFIPKKQVQQATNILDLLVQTYAVETEYEFFTDLEIEGVHFYVYSYDHISCSLTFSKSGKLYIRDQNGVKEVDEHTTFSDITEVPTTDQELQNIIEII